MSDVLFVLVKLLSVILHFGLRIFFTSNGGDVDGDGDDVSDGDSDDGYDSDEGHEDDDDSSENYNKARSECLNSLRPSDAYMRQ